MLDSVPFAGDDPVALKKLMQRHLAAAFELSDAALFDRDLTITEIVATSPKCVNSLDFMEACAKVINSFRKSHGVRIRLPETSLDTRISAIVESFTVQAHDGMVAAQSAGKVMP